MLPLLALRGIAEPISFLPSFFPPRQISLFWETSIVITSSRTQNVLPTPVGRKHSIGSSPLTFSSSMTLTYLLFFIVPMAVAPPPDIFFARFLLTLSCSWEVLQNLSSDHLPLLITVLFLRSFAPTNVSLPSIFRMLVGITLLFTSTLTVILQRNTRIFFFPLLLISLLL